MYDIYGVYLKLFAAAHIKKICHFATNFIKFYSCIKHLVFDHISHTVGIFFSNFINAKLRLNIYFGRIHDYARNNKRIFVRFLSSTTPFYFQPLYVLCAQIRHRHRHIYLIACFHSCCQKQKTDARLILYIMESEEKTESGQQQHP